MKSMNVCVHMRACACVCMCVCEKHSYTEIFIAALYNAGI